MIKIARVCTKWFKKEDNSSLQDDGFYMDDAYKSNLDILLKNFDDDWEYTIIISGGGSVRIGKSVEALQTAAYVAYEMKETYGYDTHFSLKNNVVFKGEELIDKGSWLGKNHKFSPLIYDEAGADLQGVKVMQGNTQRVIDYLRECGQYNLFTILVIPDFFDLPRGIAMSRSKFLLDVYYNVDEKDKFHRGFFKFFSEDKKNKLYKWGKKDRDYSVMQPNFYSRFFKFYPIDEADYRTAKYEALKSRSVQEIDERKLKLLQLRSALFYMLNKDYGISQNIIRKRIEQLTGQYIPHSTMIDAINGVDTSNLDDVKKIKVKVPLS